MTAQLLGIRYAKNVSYKENIYIVPFSIFTIELVDNLATGGEEEIKI